MSIESDYIQNLRYTLAKQVPDMARGFKISTGYGDFFVVANQAEPVIAAIKKIKEADLKIALEEQREREIAYAASAKRAAAARQLKEAGAKP